MIADNFRGDIRVVPAQAPGINNLDEMRVRDACLRQALEFARSIGGMNSSDVIVIADRFYQYISNGSMPNSAQPFPPKQNV